VGEPLTLPEARPTGRTGAWKVLWELGHDLSIAVLFCFFLITFVAQAFRVQGTSMLPLLDNGERIIVNKFIYRFRPIERGDIVVFWYPKDPSVSFIKRIVGLPGDQIEERNGVVYVNGAAMREDYLKGEYRDTETYPPSQVSKGHYFVMGDHRNGSNDSRSWGEVPEKYIYGKAFLCIWPLSKLGLIH
jgi:signal peptidase I